jgi:hypothetical protein
MQPCVACAKADPLLTNSAKCKIKASIRRMSDSYHKNIPGDNISVVLSLAEDR